MKRASSTRVQTHETTAMTPPKPVIPYSELHSENSSRAALELVRNSRLRSSLPVQALQQNSTRILTTDRTNNQRRPADQRDRCSSTGNSSGTKTTSPRHRKAVIPITSRGTSRVVLNNVDMDGVAADVRVNDTYQVSYHPGKATNGNKRGELETVSTDSLGSDIDCVQNEESDQMFPLQNNWRNIRASSANNLPYRYSTSSFGSSASASASEEDIWIPRTKNSY